MLRHQVSDSETLLTNSKSHKDHSISTVAYLQSRIRTAMAFANVSTVGCVAACTTSYQGILLQTDDRPDIVLKLAC